MFFPCSVLYVFCSPGVLWGKEKMVVTSIFSFSPYVCSPVLYIFCSPVLLWGKEKMMVTSIFSFSPYVCSPVLYIFCSPVLLWGKEKMMVTSIFSFSPYVCSPVLFCSVLYVFKRSFMHGRLDASLSGNLKCFYIRRRGFTLYHTIPTFNDLENEAF